MQGGGRGRAKRQIVGMKELLMRENEHKGAPLKCRERERERVE